MQAGRDAGGNRSRSTQADEEDQQDLTDEEKAEYVRVTQLTEEMSAQSRPAFDEESKAWKTGGVRETDNSRVIFPRAIPLDELPVSVQQLRRLKMNNYQSNSQYYIYIYIFIIYFQKLQ